jgi:CheY-like chemotaxis protein
MTSPAAAVARLGAGSRILVVDDDETIRRLTQRILMEHGFEVVTSSDGDAALEVTRLAMMQAGSSIHLVLTDIDMPGLGGYALGRRLSLTWPALPVVYMSGTTHGLTSREPLATWDHFIAKPFSAGDLLPKLHFALGLAGRNAPRALGRPESPCLE